MGGPIIRTGTNPKYWEGWDQVFGKKSSKPASKKPSAKPAAARSVKAKGAARGKKKG